MRLAGFPLSAFECQYLRMSGASITAPSHLETCQRAGGRLISFIFGEFLQFQKVFEVNIVEIALTKSLYIWQLALFPMFGFREIPYKEAGTRILATRLTICSPPFGSYK